MSYILSIDQSTSSTKGTLWKVSGQLVAREDLAHRQIVSPEGWIGHDPEEIYANVLRVSSLVLERAGVQPREVAAAGISNQRETAVCWDRQTGRPVCDAIVWQCARATDIVWDVREAGLEGDVLGRTGIPLSPYYSAAKFGWIMRHVPEAAGLMRQGRLCCGTVDSWLLFKLTGVHKTDYSNASRTQLLNIDTRSWDTDLAKAFGIDPGCLPEICQSDSLFGESDFGGLFPGKIPVHCMLGDSHAALFANGCTAPFTAKATYGTGSSVMMNAGSARPKAGKGIAVSLAWGMGGQVDYVLEGNINYTGAVIKWLEKDVGLLESGKQAGELAASAGSSGGVYLVPAFSGLGAPYFNDRARAAIVGMNTSTGKAQIVRAAEESIAYQIRDVVETINQAIAQPLSVLRVDGGPTRDRFLMQFQADLLQIPLEVNAVEELSAAGAAYGAAIGCGAADREALFARRQFTARTPQIERTESDRLYAGWKQAVSLINR
ncbi:glycerol kinase [Anaerotruncus rubiinfantis]|uniref:glycerol kinase n=1 Tax=Anaerotruncus rubiinfantis TaxID=1720200 RepID=UPI0034A3BBE1